MPHVFTPFHNGYQTRPSLEPSWFALTTFGMSFTVHSARPFESRCCPSSPIRGRSSQSARGSCKKLGYNNRSLRNIALCPQPTTMPTSSTLTKPSASASPPAPLRMNLSTQQDYNSAGRDIVEAAEQLGVATAGPLRHVIRSVSATLSIIEVRGQAPCRML